MNRQLNLQYVSHRIGRLAQHREKIEKRLEGIYTFRLLTATVFIVLLLTIALDIGVQIALGIEAVLIVVFSVGVWLTSRIKSHLHQLEILESFYSRVYSRMQLLPPKTQIHPENESWISHPLSVDLDLVGEESLLSMLDESIHTEGQAQLIHELCVPKCSLTDLPLRQRQIQVVGENAGLIRKFLRTAPKNIQTVFLIELLERSFVFEGSRKTHVRLWFFCGLFWFALALKLSLGLETYWGALWLIYFFYSMHSLQKIEKSFQHLQNLVLQFEALEFPFKIVELFSKKEFISQSLKNFQNSPVESLRKFRSLFSFLSVQSHPVVLLAINSLVPWNFFFVHRAEKHRSELSPLMPGIFQEFRLFDAIASLGLVYRYLTQTFPQFSENLNFEEAQHPLITGIQNISNTFTWPKSKKILLITGSNMAGKSTFLRTVGLNMVLAKMGAPVFAKSFETPILPLETCIRVSDNVREGFSYFYAETQRVSTILKSATQKKIFYLIDEVFKGTNNRERFIGAKSVITSLADTPSLGFISTHDLDLAQLNISEMANYHFRDELKNEKMHFSYKINPGPCPTTNALKIMELAGIPIQP